MLSPRHPLHCPPLLTDPQIKSAIVGKVSYFLINTWIKSQVWLLVVRKIERISKKENKLVNLRYIGYIRVKFHKNIPSSCWDRFTSSDILPNSHYQIIQPHRSSALMDQSSQNFPHLKHLRDRLQYKLDEGCSRKFFGEWQKTINFNIARIWVDFGTCKPISTTTGYIFMKLGSNIA